MGIIVDAEFEQYLPKASQKENNELLEAIRKTDNTCLDNLKVWQSNGQDILLDGHRRFRLSEKHKEIAYGIEYIDLPDRAAAFEWIYRYQYCRRNHKPTKAQDKSLRGKWYRQEKKDRGGDRKSKGQNVTLIGNTAKKVAKETGVSDRQVKRDAKFDENLDKLSPPIRAGILDGTTKATDANVAALADLSSAQQAAVVRAVHKGDAKNLTQAIRDASGSKPKKPTAPPKKIDRSGWFRQWDNAIGPLVRLVDKIGHGVNEHNGASQKRVEKGLRDATNAMMEWMQVK